METILFAVTIGALVVAFLMSATAWRLSREERARSAARVAALAAAASGRESSPLREPRATQPTPPSAAPLERATAPLPIEPRSSAMPTRVSAFTPTRVATTSGSPVPDLAHSALHPDLPLKETAAAIPDSFLGGEERRAAEGRQRGLAVAAAILFVVLGSAGYWLISGGRGARQEAATAISAASNAPLELMSLRHERLGARLSLSGLVRNPSSGAPVENLSAVVFLFDAQGAFLTSARTTVDFRRLAPGDESPFVITMDAPTNVARYRVSFRTDAGILAHVDRRSEQSASSAIAATKS